MKNPNRLTPAMRRMLERLEQGPETSPHASGRESVTLLSAWHRTAEALERRGLVDRWRTGNRWTARLRSSDV